MSIAKSMALLAQKAYDPNPTVVVGSTEAFLTETGASEWTVAFTGTQRDGADILSDIRAFPWWNQEMGTFSHSGFLKTTLSIYPEILKLLNERYALQVNFTGHSLGGARAQVMASLLRHRAEYMRHSLKVYTFGSPKVFTRPNRAMHGIEHERYVYGDDVVPKVPAMPWWEHHSEEIPLGTEGGMFTDHKMANYVEALE